ncbi:MAG TPA: hypothetical protein V6C89_03175 [Drouetiella sp.]
MNFSKLLKTLASTIAITLMPTASAPAVEVPPAAQLKAQSDRALAQLTVYKNSDYGFSIKYPQNWEKAEGQPPLICRFLTDNGLVSYRISAEKLPAPTTVEEYATYVNQELDKQYPPKDSALTRVEESASKIGKYDAHKSVYVLKLDDKGTSAKMLQYLIVANQVAYAFNYTAIEGAYDSFMPLITEVLNSFEFQSATTNSGDVKSKEKTP